MWFAGKPPASLSDLGLSDEECAALRAWVEQSSPEAGEDVWQFIGRDPDAGCDPPAGSPLDRAAFLRALLAKATSEADRKAGPQARHAVRRFFRRHWIEAGVFVLLLATAAALIRIAVVTGGGQAGSTRRVVAARDLAPGREIGREDMAVAYLAGQPEGTPDLVRILSRRPSEAVRAGRVIPLAGLQRRQVMLRSPVAAGAVIRREAVRLDWSPDTPSAFIDDRRVVGLCATQALSANALVVADNVVSCAKR